MQTRATRTTRTDPDRLLERRFNLLIREMKQADIHDYIFDMIMILHPGLMERSKKQQKENFKKFFIYGDQYNPQNKGAQYNGMPKSPTKGQFAYIAAEAILRINDYIAKKCIENSSLLRTEAYVISARIKKQTK